jgi:hypothetical protein
MDPSDLLDKRVQLSLSSETYLKLQKRKSQTREQSLSVTARKLVELGLENQEAPAVREGES